MEAMAISRAGSSSPSSLDSGACAGMEATWGEEGPDRTTAPDLDPAGAGGTASWAAALENRDRRRRWRDSHIEAPGARAAAPSLPLRASPRVGFGSRESMRR
jgi:hypothetical protein